MLAPPPPPLPPGPAAAQPKGVLGGIAGWQLAIVGGVLVLGVVFGTLVATGFGGGGSAQATTAQSSSSSTTDSKSVFQQSFEASFKNSCRQSALRTPNVTQSMADRYCDCALQVLSETHNMVKAVGTCRQRVMGR